MESSICTIFAYSDFFFWSVDCRILVTKLYFLLQTILSLWPVLILLIFSGWDIKKDQFLFLVTFLAVFLLVCKLSVNCLLHGF